MVVVNRYQVRLAGFAHPAHKMRAARVEWAALRAVKRVSNGTGNGWQFDARL
jgi:hypothetical protein